VSVKVKYRSFGDKFTQLYHMFHRKIYQENWGQIAKAVGHLSHYLVTQLKYALPCGPSWSGASPRGGLGWIMSTHFCQKVFLGLMQIRWVFWGMVRF